jgi:hypothetical protein
MVAADPKQSSRDSRSVRRWLAPQPFCELAPVAWMVDHTRDLREFGAARRRSARRYLRARVTDERARGKGRLGRPMR